MKNIAVMIVLLSLLSCSAKYDKDYFRSDEMSVFDKTSSYKIVFRKPVADLPQKLVNDPDVAVNDDLLKANWSMNPTSPNSIYKFRDLVSGVIANKTKGARFVFPRDIAIGTKKETVYERLGTSVKSDTGSEYFFNLGDHKIYRYPEWLDLTAGGVNVAGYYMSLVFDETSKVSAIMYIYIER
jgi:hypothetical protein